MMKLTYQLKFFLLLCFLPFLLIADVKSQETQHRYTDFKVIIEYSDVALKNDQKYIFEGVAAESINNPDPRKNTLYLVNYTYKDNNRLPTDTLAVILSDTEIDSLFALSANLFDLKGKVNRSEHIIPLPPLLIHEGYTIHYTFNLLFRGSKYTRSLQDWHNNFQPIHNFLVELFKKLTN